ncbi:MAG: hypothetical protein AAGB13_12445 [Cyanobacteria bacterium P01_F01_bin.33]
MPVARSELSPEGQKLALIYMRLRWVVVMLIWVGVGIPSLLILRAEISRLLEFFTWSGLKYSLLYSPIAGIGVCISLAFTLAALLWQSHYELFGLSKQTRQSIEQQAEFVRQLEPNHWIRRWLESAPQKTE